MNERVAVHVRALDPISEAGVSAALRPRPEVQLVGPEGVSDSAVAVVVADGVDDEALRLMRSLQARGWQRIVLVATVVDDGGLLAAVEVGICGLVRRCDASPERLVHAVVRAASGQGSLPPDMLGRLLNQVSRLHRQVLGPRGLSVTGLSAREVEVLRLVAEGMDTQEIARKVAYSERTVKNVLHDVTSRFQLRNRSHAVAYAMREGLI